jgi:transposase-like protein
VKVAGQWHYVDRAIDQFGQVIDVFVPSRKAADRCSPMLDPELATSATITP